MAVQRKGLSRIKRFIADNRRLLLFLLLPLLGCVCGLLLQPTVSRAGWSQLLRIGAVPHGIGGVFSQWFDSCFQPFLLLLLLFLAGLSVCGIPAALLVPVFWGFGLGVLQAGYYAEGFGGVALTAAVLLPHSAMEAVALLMGASECFRMSLRFSAVLLPRAAHGGLWQECRLYCVRFLVLGALLLGAGALDVILRLLCARWL